MKTISRIFAVIAMAACVFAACTPEDTPTPTPTPGGNNGGNNGGETVELKADFTFAANGMTVQFTNASEGATAYLWNFGDENTSTEKDPEHTYDAAGTYTVKLTVQDAAGTAKSVEKEVSVAGAVKAFFSATAKTDRAGKFGKIFTLDATSSENAASIVWDFGDGSEAATTFTVNHEFPEYDETYTVKATVTGQGGDVDTYESTVTVVGYNELLKGGSMEADDAQYWTIMPIYFAEDYENPVEGLYCWTPTFGYTDDKPANGEGGCLRFSPENQTHDYNNNFMFYQDIQLVAGDVLELSADMKWGVGSNDDGVLFICICPKAEVNAGGCPDATAVVQMFNWWMADGTSVPAYDGNLSNTDGVLSDYGYSYEGEDPSVITYVVPEDGDYAFVVDYRNVWGMTWGPNSCDVLFDNLSVKILL